MAELEGQVVLVTGAGSGVGRATAQALAEAGASVVLAGRTEATLRETAEMLQATSKSESGTVLVAPCDVTDAAQVQSMVRNVEERFGHIDVLVNNAGFNVPRRALTELSPDEWQRIVQINLDGAFFCTHGVLPIMRRQGRGTLVHVGSQAARRPSALPGAAYTAAKAGLWGLSAVINAEERRNGIRSCVIILGDTNTPLLDRRPAPPTDESRATALQPEDVATCVRLIATLPQRATIEEIVLLPTNLQ